jgi:hypothetical protein
VTAVNVYELIAACTADLAKDGIAKNSKNAQQGYAFRGIDAVFNALAPVLAKHKLVVIPRILSRECTERATQKGGVMFCVTVEAEFDFVSAIDQSKHTARTFGEAMDSGDKATNKAMSAAYKYAAFQTFCIPTEGDNDADSTTPEPIKAKVAVISDDQRIELQDIAKEKGWQVSEVVALIKSHGYNSSKDIARGDYDKIRSALLAGVPAATK